MTVHAIELVCAPDQAASPARVPSPGPPDFVASLIEERVQRNVLGTLPEALPEQAEAARLLEPNPDDPNSLPQRIRAIRRFDGAVDRKTLLDAVEQGVAADAEWYVVKHHECYADETSPAPCSPWTIERSGGDVPEGV